MTPNAGDNEGLGGLVAVVEKDVRTTKTEEGEESQEHADRRYALLDREDPRLAELDALVAEVTEDAKNGNCSYETWREDVQMAEHIFLETPDELPAWLERMRTKNLSKEKKLERVLELAEQLVRDAIIAIPPEQWRDHAETAEKAEEDETQTSAPEGDDAEAPAAPRHQPTKEEKEAHAESAIMRRLGFIFIAYRVNFWWWEGVEMLRKFLMTWHVSSFPNLFPQHTFPRYIVSCYLLPSVPVSVPSLDSRVAI